MIVSHKYKFIFIKPRKVAGTSVQWALAQFCGEDDIVTPIALSSSFDEQTVQDLSRNNEGWSTHMTPTEIRRRVGDKVWNEYTKVTIVRNPWDRLVSQYRWVTSRGKTASKHGALKRKWILLKEMTSSRDALRYFVKRGIGKALGRPSPLSSFDAFVTNLRPKYDNMPYFYDSRGQRVADVYLRFEHLQEDMNALLDQLKLAPTALPRLKTKTTSAKKKHYSEWYSDSARDAVAAHCGQLIADFDYTFEKGVDT